MLIHFIDTSQLTKLYLPDLHSLSFNKQVCSENLLEQDFWHDGTQDEYTFPWKHFVSSTVKTNKLNKY